jgi:hypothetical protein
VQDMHMLFVYPVSIFFNADTSHGVEVAIDIGLLNAVVHPDS